jgi:hypothetical protein
MSILNHLRERKNQFPLPEMVGRIYEKIPLTRLRLVTKPKRKG